jgi:ketosteroid isomerase-like protein
MPSPIRRPPSPRSRRRLIKPTRLTYNQQYVLFLRAAGGKIAFLREYFDPTRAAKAMDKPILDLGS